MIFDRICLALTTGAVVLAMGIVGSTALPAPEDALTILVMLTR